MKIFLEKQIETVQSLIICPFVLLKMKEQITIPFIARYCVKKRLVVLMKSKSMRSLNMGVSNNLLERKEQVIR
jgi:hypothetical protein